MLNWNYLLGAHINYCICFKTCATCFRVQKLHVWIFSEITLLGKKNKILMVFLGSLLKFYKTFCNKKYLPKISKVNHVVQYTQYYLICDLRIWSLVHLSCPTIHEYHIQVMLNYEFYNFFRYIMYNMLYWATSNDKSVIGNFMNEKWNFVERMF
jgi:hypothetical protein